MSESKLPEELIHEIFAFLVGEFQAKTFLEFLKDDASSPLPKLQERPGALLVSRRWFRIGAPMVYQGVVLRQQKHVSVLAGLAKTHASVRLAIRYLRLEGSSMESDDLKKVTRLARNIHTVYIGRPVTETTTSVWCLDGLLWAADLRLLRPTTLYLHLPPINSTGEGDWQAAMLGGIVLSFSSLAVVHFSYHWEGYPWVDTLHILPLLREVHLPPCTQERQLNPWSWRIVSEIGEKKKLWQLITDRPGFEAFVFHGQGDRDVLASALANAGLPQHYDKVRFVDDDGWRRD